MGTEIEDALLGKTLTSVVRGEPKWVETDNYMGMGIKGGYQDPEQIVFTLDTGEKYRLYHRQDCCESVTIEDINGDLDDLTLSPITLATEVSHTRPYDANYPSYDSETWTFYHFATARGYVTIRWNGSSNGYYSESVDFEKIDEA
jgi:hypothetical protein